MKTKFTPTECECCGQTLDYDLPLSKGLVIMLLKIYNFGKAKGLNAVHLRKEMEGNTLTSNEVGNASHLIFHGLLKDLEEAGNVAITKKGFDFLNGLEVEKTVIIKKGKYEVIGYHNPEIKTSIRKLLKSDLYWEGGYVKVGNIINKTN